MIRVIASYITGAVMASGVIMHISWAVGVASVALFALVMSCSSKAKPTPSVPDWISVDNALPDEGGRYWCYVEELTDLGFSYFQWNCAYNEREKTFSDSTFKDGERVIFWAPLPNPPKFTR
jgi:hypothetical protein